MKFLENLDFNKKEITTVEKNTSELLANQIKEQKDVVTENLKYLKELGVKNYREIFTNYSEMFLMDNSNFIEIFAKYDREDLIEKLEKNMAIIEYL